MAIKSKSEKLIRDGFPECRKVWEWLRKLPYYKQDFAMLAKTDEYKAHKAGKKLLIGGNLLGLREKWGFFPLVDPKEKFNGYLVEALSITAENPFESYLTLGGGGQWLMSWEWDEKIKQFVDIQGRKFKDLPELPEKVKVIFDPRLPLETLKKEFDQHVRHLQKLYKIKPKWSRPYDNFLMKYKAFVLKNLGRSKEQIKSELLPHVSNSSSHYNDPSESHRKKVERILKSL